MVGLEVYEVVLPTPETCTFTPVHVFWFSYSSSRYWLLSISYFADPFRLPCSGLLISFPCSSLHLDAWLWFWVRDVLVQILPLSIYPAQPPYHQMPLGHWNCLGRWYILRITSFHKEDFSLKYSLDSFLRPNSHNHGRNELPDLDFEKGTGHAQLSPHALLFLRSKLPEGSPHSIRLLYFVHSTDISPQTEKSEFFQLACGG